MKKKLWVNSDVMWYDNIINHQFSESISEKMTHLVPMNMQSLSQSIWANYSSQTWMVWSLWADFPNPCQSYKRFQSKLSTWFRFQSFWHNFPSIPKEPSNITMIQKKAHPFQFPTHLDYSKSDFSTAALTVALLPGRSACLGRVDSQWLTRLMWKKSWSIPLNKRRNGASFKTLAVKHLDVSSWKKLKHSNYINYKYYIGSFRFRSIHKC